jgi:hypothetical protein
LAAQVGPQLIPAGVELTVPAPLPALVTVIAYWSRANVAITALAPVTETVHGRVPAQPLPDHPVNVELAPGDAVNVTFSP